jgi:hypothetical protein
MPPTGPLETQEISILRARAPNSASRSNPTGRPSLSIPSLPY